MGSRVNARAAIAYRILEFVRCVRSLINYALPYKLFDPSHRPMESALTIHTAVCNLVDTQQC